MIRLETGMEGQYESMRETAVGDDSSAGLEAHVAAYLLKIDDF